jgi:hypothetical protein
MILETAQLLCTTRHILGDQTKITYKKTHERHPCQLWLMSNPNHYQWTLALGFALCNEYWYRYGKDHKTTDVMWECYRSFWTDKIPNFSPVLPICIPPEGYIKVYNLCSSPALAMPDQFKVNGDAIKSYRNYYALDKFFNIDFRYKKREIPTWISDIHSENQEIIRRYQKCTTTKIPL